jgi:hypothetical protein
MTHEPDCRSNCPCCAVDWDCTCGATFKQGYAAAMGDGWGDQGHIRAALDAAVQRVRDYLQHDVADGCMPQGKADGIIATIRGEK